MPFRSFRFLSGLAIGTHVRQGEAAPFPEWDEVAARERATISVEQAKREPKRRAFGISDQDPFSHHICSIQASPPSQLPPNIPHPPGLHGQSCWHVGV